VDRGHGDGSCFNESFAIESYAMVKLIGVGNGAGHDENMTDIAHLNTSSLIAAPANPF
jgi:hypothetical protein